MADMFAIVDKDGKMWGDVSELEIVAWLSNMHWVDKEFSEFKKQARSLAYAREHKSRYESNLEKLKDLGYRCIPVTVTPKGEVDCRLCEYFIPKDSDCGARSFGHYTACTNGDVFKPSAPIQLYNVTGG